MRQLDGPAAFAELDLAERTEHLVGEVRYRVWRCAGCASLAKTANARKMSNQLAAAGAPVGSAGYFRRRPQAGMSILPARLATAAATPNLWSEPQHSEPPPSEAEPVAPPPVPPAEIGTPRADRAAESP